MNFGNFDPGLIIITVVMLSLAPFVAVMVTSFTKMVVVLSLLRNALGLQQSPPNVVLNGLAIVLSIYVMYPVAVQSMNALRDSNAVLPTQDQVSAANILAMVQITKEPMRAFLMKHSSESERAFFLASAKRLLPEDARDSVGATDFLVIVPAFTVSELTAAFQIGFLIFLPFLVVDLVTSNILQAMGMQMLSPTTISLPFKLLLFVLIDGWAKLVHGLVLTYA
jgi:type III secretion protein R